MSIVPEASELEVWIARYLDERKRENVSPHTLRNYGIDLRQFLQYFTPPGASPPAVSAFDVTSIREWLGDLFSQNLAAVSTRRKLAALRSFFKFLVREGVVARNIPKLMRTPRAPKKLPQVMTAEQTNNLIDAIPGAKLERPHPERDLAIFETLYGCGLRVAELCGLDLDDLDFTDRSLRVRGKGRKERLVPFGAKAESAIRIWLSKRAADTAGERAVFLNHAGRRLERPLGARHRQVLRHVPGGRQLAASPCASPRLRHAPAQRWRRPAVDSGVIGPRPAVDDATLHASLIGGPDGGL